MRVLLMLSKLGTLKYASLRLELPGAMMRESFPGEHPSAEISQNLRLVLHSSHLCLNRGVSSGKICRLHLSLPTTA